jgi:hypothetical protein
MEAARNCKAEQRHLTDAIVRRSFAGAADKLELGVESTWMVVLKSFWSCGN